MSEVRRRLLLAMEPVVLEGAFAAILELIGVDEVVQIHGEDAIPEHETYDAAIVTPGFSAGARAEVVITLPDMKESGGRGRGRAGHLRTSQQSVDVEIRDQGVVINLLDEHVPAAESRSQRLAATARPMAS